MASHMCKVEHEPKLLTIESYEFDSMIRGYHINYVIYT